MKSGSIVGFKFLRAVFRICEELDVGESVRTCSEFVDK